VRGKEDPFLKIGETNDRTTSGGSDVVWSLKDINFEIEQGDAVGIIGRNGAGKSTLLKILSRITSPTTGDIKIRGRIASLLEVGTGFHPELTGRENIYLNGAILGMRKKEITRKFDEIVDFAGIERYVDTPVKRYSSGMYVRLAFAVAAHLESEILIVDEVLAVGDAEFQKKCLGKMGEVSKGEGRTVLFVSHNMGSIRNLCANAILLENGNLLLSDQVDKCINAYLVGNDQIKSAYIGSGIIKSANLNLATDSTTMLSDITLTLVIEANDPISEVVIGFSIKNAYDIPIITLNNRNYKDFNSKFINVFKGKFSVKLKNLPLLEGDYKIDLFLGDRIVDIEIVPSALSFSVNYNNAQESAYPISKTQNKLFVNDIIWELGQD
jgi:lipopolysaccharide transport system ATP-binding protein